MAQHPPHHHHTHDHGAHGHVASGVGWAFAVGILLNALFILTEVAFGLAANSLALLADAGHNAGDVLGLFLAWGAVMLSRRKPSARYTYGLQSSSILAALANAALLLVACGGIGWEAVLRFAQPEPVASATVMAVAAAGIAVNGATAALFLRGRKDDLNIRGAYLHMAADALVSAGVMAAGGVAMLTGWLWLDPAMSLLIAGVIVIGTWGLLRDSLRLALHAAPKHIDTAEVRQYLASLPGVQEVHDLHVWAISTNETALSAHVRMPGGAPGDGFLRNVAEELEQKFRIGHSTVQIETGGSEACRLADACKENS